MIFTGLKQTLQLTGGEKGEGQLFYKIELEDNDCW